MRYLFIALLAVGCAHTKSTQSTAESKEPEKEQQEGKRVEAPRPVGTTPSSITRADGIRKLQKELGVSQSGELDDSTRRALERFQRSNELAATGLPDLETVRKLGLDPDDVFQTGSRKKSEDAQARSRARKQAKEERKQQ